MAVSVNINTFPKCENCGGDMILVRIVQDRHETRFYWRCACGSIVQSESGRATFGKT